MTNPKGDARVLIIYYSFSGQTNLLLKQLATGLREEGLTVVMERLHPLAPLRFPLRGIGPTLKMMLLTLLGQRVSIKAPASTCYEKYALIILAGPTWSYNPSGPILSLLDQNPTIFADREVLPLISCRGYWRLHWYILSRKLRRLGSRIPNRMIFTHPCPEPWRTIGVFLKIAGQTPEKGGLTGRYYKQYGHSLSQQQEAYRFGRLIGAAIHAHQPLTILPLRTLIAMP